LIAAPRKRVAVDKYIKAGVNLRTAFVSVLCLSRKKSLTCETLEKRAGEKVKKYSVSCYVLTFRARTSKQICVKIHLLDTHLVSTDGHVTSNISA